MANASRITIGGDGWIGIRYCLYGYGFVSASQTELENDLCALLMRFLTVIIRVTNSASPEGICWRCVYET